MRWQYSKAGGLTSVEQRFLCYPDISAVEDCETIEHKSSSTTPDDDWAKKKPGFSWSKNRAYEYYLIGIVVILSGSMTSFPMRFEG